MIVICIARSVFIIFIFFLGCSSSHFFCEPTISIIINEGKKRTKKLTKNLKITKYYDLSLVYKKVTCFFHTLFLKLRRATHESRAEDACQLVDKSCVYLCYEPVFFLPFNRQKRKPGVALGKPYYLLDPLLAIISYFFFVFLFFYLRTLLKWTTHLDVRTVSNLLYSFTTFFLAALFLFTYEQCFPSVAARPASNILCICTQFAFRWLSECPYYYFFFNPNGFFFSFV